MNINEQIKAKANRLGFSVAGITSPTPLEGYSRYLNWLREGYHADMSWLNSEVHRTKRANPKLLDPEVRSIIVLGIPYPIREYQPGVPSNQGWISGYANGVDYHTRIPLMLQPLLLFLREKLGENLVTQVYTDNAPILERELGMRAGLGWVGKNSCLISPKLGSNFLLAEIFLNIELPNDTPYTQDRCGTCTRCIDACPTGCILSDRTIDSRNCISYHTIENRGEIPEEMIEKMGNWIFGCDICQMVCPWNKNKVERFNELNLEPQQMIDLLNLDEPRFQSQFHGSAVYRAKRSGLLRNLIIRLRSNPDLLSTLHANESVRTEPLLWLTFQKSLDSIHSKKNPLH